MSPTIDALLSRARTIGDRFSWAGPLLVRLSLAAVFILSGWGKLHDLGKVTAFFTELGIPMPGFNAGLTATTELVGGVLILFGLFTRFASLPLAFVMLIAIITARRAEIDGLSSLFAFNEFTYLACFLWLAVAGAGAVSLDRVLFGRRAAALPKPVLRPPTAASERP